MEDLKIIRFDARLGADGYFIRRKEIDARRGMNTHREGVLGLKLSDGSFNGAVCAKDINVVRLYKSKPNNVYVFAYCYAEDEFKILDMIDKKIKFKASTFKDIAPKSIWIKLKEAIKNSYEIVTC